MAIAPFLPGITAQVLINGISSEEYPDPDPIKPQAMDPDVARHLVKNTISNYIEAESNQVFSLKLTVTKPYSQEMPSKCGFHITIDGAPAWVSTCARPRVKENGGEWKDEVMGVKVGKGRDCYMRRFRFAEITTDSDTSEMAKVKRMAEQLKKVGIIEIKVYRENYGYRGGATPGDSTKFPIITGTAVPEKALKGGDAKSHHTLLGAARTVKRGDVWRTRKLDGDDYPLVVFRFMYRSLHALKQLQVIPRTPSPSPSILSSSESEPGSRSSSPSLRNGSSKFTAEQKRQLQDLMDEFEAKNSDRRSFVGKKRENKRNSLKKIKKEQLENEERRKRRRTRGTKGEEIDLTGEDEDDHE